MNTRNSHGASAPAAITAPAGLASELEQIKQARQALALEREAVRRAQLHLELVTSHGLENNIQNQGLLNGYFPDERFTLAAVYEAWKRHALIGVSWTRPFEKYDAELRAASQTADQNRRTFDLVCREVTAQGVNVASSDSNYQIVQNYVSEVGGNYSIQWLTSRITGNDIKGLHPNSTEQTSGIDAEHREQLWNTVNESLKYRDNRGLFRYREDLEAKQIKNLILTGLSYAEVKQRVVLCRRISETISRDQGMRDKEFARLLLTTTRPISELQATVDRLDQASTYRKMPVADLRTVVRNQQAANLPPQPVANRMPPEFTRRRILQATTEDLKQWILKYGLEAVNTALDDRK
jgi:hypothetical protein